MSIFNNIQNKAPKEKRRLLWIFTGISTLIIFILWIVIFPKDYLDNKEGQKSFSDLKEEFDNSEENKQFDEYMNSLEIFQNFDKQMDLESILDEAQNTDTKQKSSADKNYVSEIEDETDIYRLPLEQPEENKE